jgi:MFS family permease
VILSEALIYSSIGSTDFELGPTNYFNWILSAYTISVAVSLPLSGGLSDIFGRRWFFIVGCFVSLSGTVVALAAQNVPMVIAGMILKGIGSGSQQLRSVCFYVFSQIRG